jgi:anti-sigma factor RsiW
MKCSDVRWQLPRFLGGSTSPTEDELIRDHLDRCADCSLRLIANGRLDSLEVRTTAPLSADFTKRVLAYYPVSPSGMIMVRHLPWVFLVSAGFAVAVFLFIREMIASASAAKLSSISQAGESGVREITSLFSANPLFSYIAFAVLATILCVALVLFVDRPTSVSKR